MPQNDDGLEPVTPDAFGVVSRTESAGVVVLEVAGEVDLGSAPLLSESISTAMDQQPDMLVVDLGGVDVLTSAGVAVLLGSHKRAMGKTEFRIVAPRATSLRPLQVLGLTKVMSVYSSTVQALSAT